MERVRMDKWLWAARFFKTRALAVRACELGRIQANGQLVKSSREVHVGDALEVKNDSGLFQIKVLVVSDMRVGAAIAQTMYLETEESRAARAKAIEDRKTMGVLEGLREGRPSKRERRELERFRGLR